VDDAVEWRDAHAVTVESGVDIDDAAAMVPAGGRAC
jgi:hypothetical protein